MDCPRLAGNFLPRACVNKAQRSTNMSLINWTLPISPSTMSQKRPLSAHDTTRHLPHCRSGTENMDGGSTRDTQKARMGAYGEDNKRET